MARKVKVVPNPDGYREVMNGPEVQRELRGITSAIGRAANEIGHGTYVYDVQPGVNRAHGRVSTSDVVSRVDNARRNILLKAIRRTE